MSRHRELHGATAAVGKKSARCPVGSLSRCGWNAASSASAQHHHRVGARIPSRRLSWRSAVMCFECSLNPEVGFKLLMLWLRKSIVELRSVRPAAVNTPRINDLHEIEEVVQIEHMRLHRSMHWTVEFDFPAFRPMVQHLFRVV